MNLYEYQDLKYREFNQKIVNTKYPMIGVRIPILRQLAKNITYEEFIKESSLNTYEEVMLLGMLIPKIKDEAKRIKAIKDYIKYIDCWSLCDTFCSNLKFIKKDLDKYYSFIISYLSKSKIYYIRFGLVMLLKYVQEDKYWDDILNRILLITNNDYYVQMATAWLLSEMAVYNKERILLYAKKLNPMIKKMLYQKMKDSYRIA